MTKHDGLYKNGVKINCVTLPGHIHTHEHCSHCLIVAKLRLDSNTNVSIQNYCVICVYVCKIFSTTHIWVTILWKFYTMFFCLFLSLCFRIKGRVVQGSSLYNGRDQPGLHNEALFNWISSTLSRQRVRSFVYLGWWHYHGPTRRSVPTQLCVTSGYKDSLCETLAGVTILPLFATLLSVCSVLVLQTQNRTNEVSYAVCIQTELVQTNK